MRENSLWDASWQHAIAFQRELLAIAGWPDCRAAYEENLQKAKDRAAYCQQLLDHPQRGGQGTDIASRKRALADALAGVAWRQALLDGLKEAEASERGLIRTRRRRCSPARRSYFLRLRRSQISAAIEPTTPIAAMPEKASISGTSIEGGA